MSEIITTLHKKNDATVEVYPNIKAANIPAGSIDNTKLASNAVATSNIQDVSITTAKINADAITTAKINDAAVTTGKLADSSVTTSKIGDGAVTSSKIGDGAVTTSKIGDSAIALNKLSNTVKQYTYQRKAEDLNGVLGALSLEQASLDFTFFNVSSDNESTYTDLISNYGFIVTGYVEDSANNYHTVVGSRLHYTGGVLDGINLVLANITTPGISLKPITLIQLDDAGNGHEDTITGYPFA